MNQQLTNDEKARIFCMYWGQKVYGDLQDSDEQCNYGEVDMDYDNLSYCVEENMKLLLTDLKEITDEHAIEVAKLCFQMPNSNFIIEKRDKHGLHIYCREKNGIIHHARISFNGEVKPNLQFEADEKEKFRSFVHQIGGVHLTDKRPIPYLAIVDFYRMNGYDTPLFFGVNHWANGKTAIELGIAIPKTTKP